MENIESNHAITSKTCYIPVKLGKSVLSKKCQFLFIAQKGMIVLMHIVRNN